jgi:DeoR/GlpR family transcriptional regulator of sugar metabolism
MSYLNADQRIEQIQNACFEFWLENQRGATAADLAKRCNISVSTVRKYIWDAPKLAFVDEYNDVVESSYRTVMYQRKVEAWQPSRKWLTEEILRLQAAVVDTFHRAKEAMS